MNKMVQRLIFVLFVSFLTIFLVSNDLLAKGKKKGRYSKSKSKQYLQGMKDTVSQVSTLSALLHGVYDGDFEVMKLKKYGSFGLGTFAGIDGEMIMLNGKIYKVDYNGKVSLIKDRSIITPFAVVSSFNHYKRQVMNFQSINMKNIQITIDKSLETKNSIYALQIKGKYKSIKLRSVNRQEKPYPPLKDVVAKQSIFNVKNIKGTIVGYRFPEYLKEVNVKGYHFHFISKNKRKGGHVLDFILADGRVIIEDKRKFNLILSKEKGFNDIHFEEKSK